MRGNLKIALIDNDALVNLFHIDGILDLMRNLFSRLEIPQEVKSEFEKHLPYEPTRSIILNKLRPNSGFWSLCTELDFLSQTFLFNYKGIDKGEAELVSQGEKKGIRIIISDDQKFTNTLLELNKNFLVVNSLFIVASLDINGFLPDVTNTLQSLFDERKYKSKNLREAYHIALKEYGIKWTKKKISEKSSLKKLGIL